MICLTYKAKKDISTLLKTLYMLLLLCIFIILFIPMYINIGHGLFNVALSFSSPILWMVQLHEIGFMLNMLALFTLIYYSLKWLVNAFTIKC